MSHIWTEVGLSAKICATVFVSIRVFMAGNWVFSRDVGQGMKTGGSGWGWSPTRSISLRQNHQWLTVGGSRLGTARTEERQILLHTIVVVSFTGQTGGDNGDIPWFVTKLTNTGWDGVVVSNYPPPVRHIITIFDSRRQQAATDINPSWARLRHYSNNRNCGADNFITSTINSRSQPSLINNLFTRVTCTCARPGLMRRAWGYNVLQPVSDYFINWASCCCGLLGKMTSLISVYCDQGLDLELDNQSPTGCILIVWGQKKQDDWTLSLPQLKSIPKPKVASQLKQ